jgi:Family of unknown function (DUF6122)
MQPIIHYSMHFVVPLLFAWVIDKKNYLKIYAILLCTMLIDVDHLFANPIFMADRCSINFHVLHNLYFVPIYMALLFFKGTWRVVGIGLCFHIFTDFCDCAFMFQHCNTCFANHSLQALFQFIFNGR